MKNLLYLFVISCMLGIGCSPVVYVSNQTSPPHHPAPPRDNSFQEFYDALGPYGRWIDYPGEGYVWVPNVDPGFKPYATNGHWVYSDAGWTWVSNYSWGWAPFHYGRWFFENGYGWMWQPGHEWAPAWVTWGRSGDYYGWAPIAPHIDIKVTVGGGWTPPENTWTFVPSQHITKPNVINYVVDNHRTVVNNTTIVKNVTIINNVTNNNVVNATNNNIVNNNVTNNNITNNHVVNNVTYNRGPQVNEVEHVTNNKVERLVINDNPQRGVSLANHQLMMYRPMIRPNVEPDEKKPMPQRVETYRRGNNQQN